MEKPRRLTGLWRALSEHRAQSLPSMSKRITAGLRSILARKTGQSGVEDTEQSGKLTLSMDGVSLLGRRPAEVKGAQNASPPGAAAANSGAELYDLSRTDFDTYLEPKFRLEKSKDSDVDDESLAEAYSTEAAGKVSRKPSTKSQQEIINWMNQQRPAGESSTQHPNGGLPVKGSILGSGGEDADAASTNERAATPSDDARSSSPEKSSTRKPQHSRNSQDPKSRVIRESQQDQFAPVSRRGTFESQHRGIYAFKIHSTTSIADQFPLSRRDSEATVGTTVSGTVSDVTSSKRFSASTIATTLTMAASSETLHGQFKRIRPDSRSSSCRSGSIPSVRSSAHAPSSHGLRYKAVSSAPRDADPGLDEQPPIPAIPRQSSSGQNYADNAPLPAPPNSVLEAGTLAQERRGKHTGSSSGAAVRIDIVEEPQVSTEVGDGILSVINEHASDAGSAMIASPRPSVDRRPETHELFSERSNDRQSSEGPSIFSRGTSPLESSATSAGDLEHSRSSQENSDIEETMSDVTDHTDLSLIEAFEALPTRLNPAFLSLLVTLKEEVVRRIQQRLQTIFLQGHGTQERPTQPSAPGSGQPETSAGSTSRTDFLRALPTLRKRAFEGDDNDSFRRRDGDDWEKRKREDITPKVQLKDQLRKFACPYYKKYPESDKLSKSCRAPGWDSVHRVKEHIYRRHQRPPFRCPRCLHAFENENMLTEHQRAVVICETSEAQSEEETTYITKSQEMELRKRKRETSEEEKWFNIFRILFPGIPAEEFPSPYHEACLQALSSTSVELTEFRAFLHESLPSRVISDLNNHLRVQVPGFVISGDLTDVIRNTVREVMEDFHPIFVPVTPEVNGSEDWGPRVEGPRQSQANAQVLGAPICPHENWMFPPPVRPAPSPPATSQWTFPPLSESPSVSTFDFGFSNQVADVTAIPHAVGEVSTLWDFDEDYNTGPPSFGGYLEN
ncbi:hypothetical protein B0T14DRAFT_236361 [Immersiella caudata]|uniref:C2H2-type domain-containing protein n=1 Tax=Immersiella caudata TaxID=314043 RepID=A0AA39WSC0_9PEZI|nr:hypothetical protein B0T14DRAFT_236361 [Immersiella caudata]